MADKEEITGAFYGCADEQEARAKASDWLYDEPHVASFELGAVYPIREGHAYSVQAFIVWREQVSR